MTKETKIVDIKVPDIGDFSDVPVIEILVKPGDSINPEDSLVTLESDKATMDIPSPIGGVVKSIDVNIGDTVSEGVLIAKIDSKDDSAEPSGQPQADSNQADQTNHQSAQTAAAMATHATSEKADINCEMLVLGAGPGGYSAAFRSADLGMQTILVERFGTLGGVCLNVGCIPSKALLHVAGLIKSVSGLKNAGIDFGAPKGNLDQLKEHKTAIISKLTQGLSSMAKSRKVSVVRGIGQFVDPHHLLVEETQGDGQEKSGKKMLIHFQKCIIAAGSTAVHLPFIPKHEHIIDSTGALALKKIPKKMLVIGGGIIGLEMATVYAALGAQIDIVEMMPALMQGPDRDLVKVWEKRNTADFGEIMLGTKTVKVEPKKDGIWVTFEGPNAPEKAVRYDLVLQSAGRRPNGLLIDAQKAGVHVEQTGFIPVDSQQRTNVAHIFAIGDIVGQPMLAHKAVHESHVAAEAANGMKSHFNTSMIPSVAYTLPEVAWVGLTEAEAKEKKQKIRVAKFPWAASGRAIANHTEDGFTKLIFDDETRRIIGGGIVGDHAGDLIGEVALAIEMGADEIDIGKTLHPHPTLGETIGLAAEVAHGSCTDLPAQKKPSK